MLNCPAYQSGRIFFVEALEAAEGAPVLARVCELGLEGIVAKRVDAPYRAGPSHTWLNCRCPTRALSSPASPDAISTSSSFCCG